MVRVTVSTTMRKMFTLAGASSIRRTLFLWLLPLATAFMVVAWLAHGALMNAMLSNFLDSRLQEEAKYVQSGIAKRYPDLDTWLLGDAFFADAFHHIFVIRIGERIWSNRPELESVLAGGTTAHEPQSTVLYAGDIRLYAVRTKFQYEALDGVILVAENLESLESDQARLHAWVAVVSLGLLLILVALIVMAVQFALRPVERLGSELARLQSGGIERLTTTVPSEFEGLVTQLNSLLDTLDVRLKRSREALANLSHSIKTPIAAIGQVLTDTDVEISSNVRQQLISRLGTIHEQLEAELRRSRLAGPQTGKTSDPVVQARELAWMFGRLYPEKNFELTIGQTISEKWPIEEQDFNELLGNLMDNAGKWSARECRVSLEAKGGKFMLTVADDGVGVATAQQGELGRRGLRLDEQTHGHGLGLAIVRDVVDRYGGSVSFSTAPQLGGLLVTVSLPGCTLVS